MSNVSAPLETDDQRLFARGVTSQMIDSRVVRDFVNPGGELEFLAVAAERAVNLDKDLLSEIEGRLVVADHAVDVGRDGAPVAAYKFFKTSLDAADGSGHELAVSCRGQIS